MWPVCGNWSTKAYFSRILSIEKFRSITIFRVSDNLMAPLILENRKQGNVSIDLRWSSKMHIKLLRVLEDFTAFEFDSIGRTNRKYRYLNVFANSFLKKCVQLFLKPGNFSISVLMYRSSFVHFSGKHLIPE